MTDIPLSEQPVSSDTEDRSERQQLSKGDTEDRSEQQPPASRDAENSNERQQSFSNEQQQLVSRDAENSCELPIDELPTAHVPSVANPSSFAPISLLPFTTEFPLEAEQAFITQTSPDDEVTIPAAPLPPSHPGLGRFALPSRAKKDASSSLVETNVPSEQLAAATPPEVAAFPIQPDGRQPVSQSGQNEPLVSPGLNEQQPQSNQSVPLSQPELAEQTLQAWQEQQDETRPFSQVGMYPVNTWSEAATLPLQAGMNMPSSLAGMYAESGQAGMYAAPVQPGMGAQAQYLEIGERPPQSGDVWQPWQEAENYQAPPMPERLGNVYPGPLESASPRGSVSQGGRMPSAALPAGGMNVFIQPLPRWVMVVGPLGGVALLTDLIFVNADWATGTVAAALVAIILAILLGIAAGVRIALGMLQESNPRRRSQVISTALLILLLFLFSGIGISQQNSLHMAQGRYLESHQNWAAAITQYQAAGERSSAALDVARTYDEWGEVQNRQQQYAGAVIHFSTVLQNYQDTANEFKTAQNDIIVSYVGWAAQATRQHNYVDATAHYDALLALPFCMTTCKSSAQPKDANAYYSLAEQQLSQHQYAQAVSAYQALATRFPQAPETGQIHTHYAQALWGKGQQEVNTTCSDALSTYRLLTRLFADTSQGKQAATALTQPVAVKGHFIQTIPGAPFHPTAYLVQGLFVGIQQAQVPSLLAQAPAVPIHSDGTFTFTSVPQGVYELIWSSDNTLHFYYAFSGQHILYTAHPGPLCTYNYGDIDQAIPTGAQ